VRIPLGFYVHYPFAPYNSITNHLSLQAFQKEFYV